MPNAKQEVIDQIYLDSVCRLAELSSDDDEEFDSIVEETEWNLFMAHNCRYGDIVKVPKQKNWLTEILPNYDEGRFRQVTRVSHEDFDKIYNLIRENPVFHTTLKRPQLPISVQLAMTLFRLGFNGSASSVHNVARLFGVGDGSTVYRVTKRVFKAIRDLQNVYIYWPDPNERKEMIIKNAADLPGIFGYMDGTSIKLEKAPQIDKDSYYDKNKNYSLKVQLICDNDKKIRHFVSGYPGSVHDSRVWNECPIAKNLDTYFSNGEWIAADKGYSLSSQVITPYRINTTNVSEDDLNKFNKHFSRYRVKIEHVNGVLKETWSSLKELRIRIKDHESHKRATEWINICLILYNITLKPAEDEITGSLVDYDMLIRLLSNDPEEKRKQLLQYIVETRTE